MYQKLKKIQLEVYYMLNLFTNDFFDKIDRSFDESITRNIFPAIMLRNMRTDIKSTEDSYLISMDVPGFKKEDITISIDDLILTVVAENKEKSETSDHDVIAHERCEGHCERRIRLNDDVDIDKISAKLKNGVLTIMMPKVELPKKNIKTVTIE